jgi:hypothetical protein
LPPLLIPVALAIVTPSFRKLYDVTYRDEPKVVATKARLLPEGCGADIWLKQHAEITKKKVRVGIREFIYFNMF